MMLGERVREARRALGMTVAALADASGLTKGFISQFERGLSNPSLESLRRIAATLDISLTGLLSDDDGLSPLQLGRDAAPTLIPSSDWVEKRRGVFPVSGGQSGQAIVQLPPGAWLTHESKSGGDRPRRMACFVVQGQARFTQDATAILLGSGDALAWNSRGIYRVENSGPTLATLLVTGPGADALKVTEQPRAAARAAGMDSAGLDAVGPLRLVAMRAQRQGRKGG